MVKFSDILWHSLLLGMLYFLFFPPSNKFIWLAFLSSWIFAGVVKYFVIKRYSLNERYFLFVVLALLFNMIGEVYLYRSRGVDKFLHFFNGGMITFMIHDFFKKREKQVPNLFVFLAVVGCMAFFEIFDFALFSVGFNIAGVYAPNGVIVITPYADTMWDIIWGCISSMMVLICLKLKGEKNVGN